MTVEELIELLKTYPQDAKISYDFGLPIEIYELEDGSLTIT